MANGRNYTDADRAGALAALDANGGNLKKTARELGIPRQTMQRWITERTAAASGAASEAAPKKSVAQAAAELAPVARLALDQKIEAIAHKIADAMPEKIGRAGLQSCAVSLGIAIEKMRLLREQATGIQGATDGLTDEKRYAAILALLTRYSQSSPRQIVDGTSNGTGPAVEPNGSAHEGGHNPGSVAG